MTTTSAQTMHDWLAQQDPPTDINYQHQAITVYDTATGKILYSYAGTNADANKQLPNGMAWIAGEYNNAEFRVVGGAAVAYPTKPNEFAVWDYAADDWVDGDLAFVKSRVSIRVNATAGELILQALPLWKQSNLTARAVELQSIGQSNWTTAEQTEWDDINSKWDFVKSIRSKSNTAISLIAVATSVTQIIDAEAAAFL